MPTEEPAPFQGLTTAWALDVATRLDAYAGDRMPAVDDLWLTEDLALLMRYRVGENRLAVRVGRLDVDPTSATAPLDAAGLASSLLHSLHAPDPPAWVDRDAYRWWGDPPTVGWPAVFTATRLRTLR